MKKIIINQNQIGLLFKNGKLVKMLSAGKYYTTKTRQIEVLSRHSAIMSSKCSLDALLANEKIKNAVQVLEVGDEQLALHYMNGQFSSVIQRGSYAFLKDAAEHKFTLIDISTPEVGADVPRYIFSRIPATFYVKAEITEHQKGRLYFDNKFIRMLDSGTYYFWRTGVKVELETVDTRLTQINITGQEILTQDKVLLRINLALSYKITDYVKIRCEVKDFEEQIHVIAQLALREYVGTYKLDDLLENKEQLSRFVLDKLRSRQDELYVEIFDAGVKDIILPGEIRDIMNTVLIAEKRAQANVITRREEVASTRSLLNTAKLMDENKTLYKLKELEYVERICENVGSLNVSAGADILTQLTSILKSKE